MGLIDKYINFFEKNYKLLIIIPLLLLFFSFLIIGQNYAKTNSFVQKDVSLKGGISITIDNTNSQITDSIENLEKELESEFDYADFSLQEIINPRSVLIHAADIEVDKVKKFLENKFGEFEKENYNVKIQSSQFGESFFTDTLIAIIIAFLFMGIIVFIYFRKFAPSLGVVLSAFSDIIITVAVINLLEIRLSTAGVAAILMIIGYSVDTNILLSSKILSKSDETFSQKMSYTMNTGLMMTFTTLGALIAGLLFAKAPELIQIFTILLIGLLTDLIMTWIQNAAILKYFSEDKNE